MERNHPKVQGTKNRIFVKILAINFINNLNNGWGRNFCKHYIIFAPWQEKKPIKSYSKT